MSPGNQRPAEHQTLVLAPNLGDLAMKMRLLGVTFTPGEGISLDDFQTYLQKISGQTLSFGGHDRIYRTKTDGKYNVSLLVTIKDQKRFLELKAQNSGKLRVEVRELMEGTLGMELNYLVQYRETGTSLYLHYHHSCALNQFAAFLGDRYSDYKSARIEHDTKAAGGEGIANSKKVAIRKKYKGSLTHVQLVTDEDLDDLMQQMHAIKSFEFTVASVRPDDPVFAPVSKYVRRRVERVVFNSDYGVSAIASGIKKITRLASPDKGRVIGVDESGVQQIANLLNNYETFGEYEFDEEARHLTFELDEFHHSPMIKKMKKVIEDRPAVFTSPVKP
ncbi:hypothetical protein [Pyxidicoccus trucidator]|uniref:hypothetical protein n=1 Tax=Pyxidicoccus trucidator TaxID=2709662 RepID=UPI0013D995B1|nr:hypothetical protein [Pyxidicoccus trucidator]